MIPEGAIILENFCGTAPGIILEEENKRIILMPGPPREMKDMFEKKRKTISSKIQYKKNLFQNSVRSIGIGEITNLRQKIKTYFR